MKGRHADDAGRGLGLHAIALILPPIFLRSRSTRDRLPSASERLPPDFCWIPMTMAKKFASGDRHPLGQRSTASPTVRPMVCASMMRRNSRAHRLGRLACDDAQAVAERQAGLDAAHDDVDGVRKLVDELVRGGAS